MLSLIRLLEYFLIFRKYNKCILYKHINYYLYISYVTLVCCGSPFIVISAKQNDTIKQFWVASV